MNNTVLPTENRDALAQFQQEVNALSGKVGSVQNSLSELLDELRYMKEAIKRTPVKQIELMNEWKVLDAEIAELQKKLNWDRIASRLDIDKPPTIGNRVGYLMYEQGHSTGAPTETHRMTFAIAKEEFAPIYERSKQLVNTKFNAFRKKLKEFGAPYTPGNIHFLD